MAISFVAAFSFRTVEHTVESAIERLFFKKRLRTEMQLHRASRAVLHVETRDAITDYLAKVPVEILELTGSALYWRDRDTFRTERCVAARERLPRTLGADDAIIVHLAADLAPIRIHEIGNGFAATGSLTTAARIVFGISAILAGVASLLSRETGLLHHLLAFPQIVAGIAILPARTSRAAGMLIVAVYACFTLSNVPGMIAKPSDPVRYIDFFEELAVACGALAVCISPAFATTLRIALGVCALSFAWAQLVYLKFTASLVPAWIPPNQMFWTILTTAAFALAGVAMLINVYATLATRLMAIMLALFGLLVWVPQIAAHPKALDNWSEFALNNLIAAAAWLVAELPEILFIRSPAAKV